MKLLIDTAMKTLLHIVFVALFFSTQNIHSQCTFNNTPSAYGVITLPSCPGSSTLPCVNGGEDVSVNVVAGNQYVFSTCGSTTFDSQLTLYDATGVTSLGYNDDFCGVQSEITWVATYTGVVHVLLDQYSCASNTTCMELNIDCSVPIATGNGCNTDNSICTTGVAGPFGFGTAGNDPNDCLAWLSSSQYSYIILYITQSGPLNILIDGDQSSGYLDVSIYNIPNGQLPCAALIPANMIGCNFASSASGCNEFGTSFGCASTVPAPNVTAGQQLMIIVEDYADGASSNYTLELAPVPAAQTGPPDPTITSVGPFCSNAAAVQLAAANMGGDWTGPGVSLTGLFDPAVAGPGTHTITYSIGQAPCNGTATTTIVVNALPTVTFNSPSICSGQSIALTATPSTAGGTYAWNPSGSTQTITVSPTTTTNYSLVYTLNGCSSAPATGTVTVTPFPPFTPTGTNPTICNASDGYITISGLTASTNHTVSYTDDGVVQGPTAMMSNGSGIITLTNLNSGTYTAITISDGSCSLVNSSTVTLANPGAPTITNPGNQTVCDTYTLPVISGTNLTGNQAYYNNSQALGGTVITGNITSSQTVWIYDSNGTCSDEKSFVVTVNQTPSITTPSNVSICNSYTLPTITGTNLSGNEAFYNNSQALGGTVITGPITTSQTVWLYDSNGTCSDETSFAVTITSNPTVTLNSPTICNGQSATVTATPSTGGGTYVWNTTQTTQSINVSPTTTTTYSVTYTLNGCVSNTVTTSVTVNPIPTVSANSATICSGTSTTLTATPSTGSGTYVWTPSGTTQSISVSPTTTTNYTVIYTLNGCSSTPTSTTVTVNPAPTVGVNSPNTCSGQTVAITATPQNTGGTFLWNTNETTATINVSPTVTTTYTVVYTLNGCSSAPASGTVNIFTPPPLCAGLDIEICSGTTGSIGANPITGYVYSWATNPTGLDDPNSSMPNVTLTNLTTSATTATYTVDVTSSEGCTSTDDVIVTIIPNPTVSFTADTTSGCDPLLVTFTNTSTPSSTSVSWNFGDGSSSNTGINTVSHTFIGADCRDITLTATTNNCSSSLTMPQMICTQASSVASFGVNQPSATVLEPSFTFYNYSQNATDYSWDFGDSTTSTIEDPAHDYDFVQNVYTVTLIASSAGQCPDTAQQIIYVNDILIYYIPNTFTPDGNNFNQTFQPVFTSGFDAENYEMKVMNRWGEVIFESQEPTEGWDGSYNGQVVQDGIYSWKVVFRDHITDKKYVDSGFITLIR